MTTPNQRWRERNPEKVAAHIAVNEAVKHGRLTPGPCEQCGASKAHAHHDDYSQPLVVRWLCSLCHKRHHNPNPSWPLGKYIRRGRTAPKRSMLGAQARALRQQGCSYPAIARALSIAISTAYEWCKS